MTSRSFLLFPLAAVILLSTVTSCRKKNRVPAEAERLEAHCLKLYMTVERCLPVLLAGKRTEMPAPGERRDRFVRLCTKNRDAEVRDAQLRCAEEASGDCAVFKRCFARTRMIGVQRRHDVLKRENKAKRLPTKMRPPGGYSRQMAPERK